MASGSAAGVDLSAAAKFVEQFPIDARVTVLRHSDGDGVGAGAILVRALRRRGHPVAVRVTRKGSGAWSEGVAAGLADTRPAALVVADLGCRAEPVLTEVPTLFIDHHRPDGVPEGSALLTGYGVQRTPTSGLLAYRLVDRLQLAEGLDWLAAVSTLSDVGDLATFPELAHVKAKYKITHLREVVALVNAPRRTAAGDGTPALELLLEADGPTAIARGAGPAVDALHAAMAEVAEALAAAKMVGPKFVKEVAFLRLNSSCQVHPLIAAQWRTRLPKHIILSANCGYLPARVNFSMRTRLDVNLLDFLSAHRPESAGGKGHDQATGGSLPAGPWNAFIKSLGFGPEGTVDGDAIHWIDPKLRA